MIKEAKNSKAAEFWFEVELSTLHLILQKCCVNKMALQLY